MKEEPVTIVDRDVLKVLSADTRMDILKELGEGSRTPSDLSKRLNKSNATIVEHLEVMRRTGLVKRIEQPGKKWIFYTLTERGKGIVSSKSRRLVIILSVSILMMIGGFYSLGIFFYNYNIAGISLEEQKMIQVPGIRDTMPQPQYNFPIFLYLGISLIGAAILGIILYIRSKSKSDIRRVEEFL